MSEEKALSFIESSFLGSLLTDENITDISFNGENICYLHNEQGRKVSSIKVENSEIYDFIRQMANLTEKQFSFQTPILDVSIGKYRLNAVHQSIGRINGNPTLTFSIRIASLHPRITDESAFMTPELTALFEVLLRSRLSLVVGGLTGSGKTEFQKYLLRKIPDGTRIIVIDNVLELEQVRSQTNLDINTWQVDERNNSSSIQGLVKNALRSNPDWLIVAESRGSEMIEILNSAMTGHPIITTMHSIDGISMPSRIVRMIMMNDKKMDYEDIYKDVLYHFRFYVYLAKEENEAGAIKRYIQSIFYMDENAKSHAIYQFDKNGHLYQKMCKSAIKLLKFDNNDEIFKKTFVGAES